MMPITQLCLSVALLGANPTTAVLDFTASWCGPCQQMSPIVTKLERQGLPIRTIDVDQHPDLVRQYGIEHIPAFVLVVDGTEVERHVGHVSESTLRRMAAQAASRPNPNREQTKPNREQERRFEKPRNPVPFLVHNPLLSVSKPRQTPVIRAKYEVPDSSVPEADSSLDLSCCVRIRVRDSEGVNYGSGTIIASQPGRSVILTCGHIFRSSSQSPRIDVDVFNRDRVETFSGELVRYDLEADVGLLTIPSVVRLSSAKVAPVETLVRKGNSVLSMGCSAGDTPSEQSLRVTALNRYLGPDNVECTGVPIQGRSGGGLFNADGAVIGVCIAADPRDQRGLYAGLKPIQTLLQRCGLAYLYQKPTDAVEEKPLIAATTAPRNRPELNERPLLLTAAGRNHKDFTASVPPANEPFRFNSNTQQNRVSPIARNSLDQNATQSQPASNVPSPMLAERANRKLAERANERNEQLAAAIAAAAADDDAKQSLGNFGGFRSADPSDSVQKVFDQVGAAEVVCVIRSLENPRAASHIVIINRASAAFVADLIGEVQAQTRPTSLTVPWTGAPRRRPKDSAPARMTTTNAALIPDSLHAVPQRYQRSQTSRRFP